jgi:glucokinase
MAVAGVDLGGTKISVAVVDPDGQVLARTKQPVRKTSLAESVEQIADLIEARGVAAAGVCVPGIYFAATGNAWAPNLWGWEEVPLRAALESRVHLPITIDSDRAACVLGEQWLGAARGLSDVVFLAVGTGIGAGILSGGRLVRGADDIAGAAGWFALDPRKKEIYRQLGCFEAEAAGPAVARRAGARTAEAVVEAARAGDARARAVLEETAAWLAMGIANLVSLLNPQMVVLGGGLMQAGDLLLERIRGEMLEWAQPIAAKRVRVELTRLGEDAGVLGAARLALIEHHVG